MFIIKIIFFSWKAESDNKRALFSKPKIMPFFSDIGWLEKKFRNLSEKEGFWYQLKLVDYF